MKKYFLGTFLLLITILVSFNNCIAFDYINEHFISKNETSWNYSDNGGQILINNSIISLGTTGNIYPLIRRYSKGEIFPTNVDSVIEIKFKYNKISPSGAGIGIGFTGINGKPFYVFGLWADTSIGGVGFVSNYYFTPEYGNCTNFNNQDYYSYYDQPLITSDFNWHVLRIEKTGIKWQNEQYVAYLDKGKNPNPIFTSRNWDCNPQNLWIGNPLSGGGDWSDFSIDYIKGFDLGGSEDKSTKDKIIFIPGMGASWNTEAMVYDRNVGDDQWKMTPFAKNYDNFLNALNNNGLVHDEDYFVWNYDWRRPIAEIEEKFNNYLNSTIGSGENVYIIGHSLGGVVGRIWYQDHVDDGRVKNVISVGSPQSGALDPYALWNSGHILSKENIASTALNIVLTIQGKFYKNRVETLRNFVPSVKDMLPVFDFVKKNNQTVKFNNLTTINDYLLSQNLQLEPIFGKYQSIVGSGVNTAEWINLGKRSALDGILNRWPDGVPISFVDGSGDGTVLVKSAKIKADPYDQILGGHGDLVNLGGSKILEYLNLEGDVIQDSFDLNNKRIYFIGSPAVYSVECTGQSKVDSDDQGFALTESNKSPCRVTISGTGNGTYHFVYGDVGNDDSFKYLENEISTGQTDSFVINGESNTFWWELLAREAKILQTGFPGDKTLAKIVKDVEKRQAKQVLDDILKYRRNRNETVASGRMIDYVANILAEEDGLVFRSITKIMALEVKYKLNRLENDGKLTEWKAANLVEAEQYLRQANEDMKNNFWRKAQAEVYLVKQLISGL